MLCASEGLTFGLRPNALGLRSSPNFIRSRARVKRNRVQWVPMQLVLQKVSSASVTVEGRRIAAIGRGYLILLGVAAGDTDEHCAWLARKVAALRLFTAEDGTINDRTVRDVSGAALVVSQFTLLGSVEGGNRPDYTAAAPREDALRLYESFVGFLRAEGVHDVQTGMFGASMAVESVNDGPVTLLIGRS